MGEEEEEASKLSESVRVMYQVQMFPTVLELMSLSRSFVDQFNFLELGLFTQSILPEFFSSERSLLLYIFAYF